jgi:hypothetical protein
MCERAFGYIHSWGGSWGVIYSPGRKKYFLHRADILNSGMPQDGARVQFEIGPARSAADLPTALNVAIVAPPIANGGAQ